MINWDALLYDQLFASFGTPAVLQAGAGSHMVTVIDQTAGIEVDAGGLNGFTIKPVAEIRLTELAGISIEQADLKDATLTIGSNAWIVKNTAPKPGPGGKGTGILQLILINGDL